MPIADEHIPLPALRDAIIAKAVLPQIAVCAVEVGCPESFRGVVRVQKRDAELFGAPNGFWTVRLIVRHTSESGRYLFRINALIPKRADTGFCGFQMRGEAIQKDSAIQILVSAWSGLYNTTGNENWS